MLLRLSYGLATYGSFRWIGGAWRSETLNKGEPAWNNIIQIFIFNGLVFTPVRRWTIFSRALKSWLFELNWFRDRRDKYRNRTKK